MNTNQGQSVGIGLAGLGTVGAGVWNLIHQQQDLLSNRTRGSVSMRVASILVRDRQKALQVEGVRDELISENWQDFVADPNVHVVVELIGGITTAYDLVKAALLLKKPVVTGNKALLAECGAELFAMAREMNTPIFFEAAVAGGIPIIRTLQESYVSTPIESMYGIINGTSNFILESMTQSDMSFEEALAQAQALGYAEADPTLDVNGWDAAHKALILAMLAYGFPVEPKDIYVSGIEQVRRDDIAFAKKLGYVVKLLAVIRKQTNGSIECRVQPSFIPQSHILASVSGVFNAVAVNSDIAGEALYFGRGAGQGPTATSVMADLVESVRTLSDTCSHRGFLPYVDSGAVLPVEDTVTSYYVRLDVTDRPGVLAEVAKIFAEHEIGISGQHSPIDANNPDAAFVDMVILLHRCSFGRLQAALKVIEDLDCINSTPVVFRIETLS